MAVLALIVGLLVWAMVATVLVGGMGDHAWPINIVLLFGVVGGSIWLGKHRAAARHAAGMLELAKSGFTARHQVRAGHGRLYFDPDRREVAIFSGSKLLRHLGYDQIDQWTYMKSPTGPFTYMLGTLDPAHPVVKWHGRSWYSQENGETFLAAVTAVMSKSVRDS